MQIVNILQKKKNSKFSKWNIQYLRWKKKEKQSNNENNKQ